MYVHPHVANLFLYLLSQLSTPPSNRQAPLKHLPDWMTQLDPYGIIIGGSEVMLIETKTKIGWVAINQAEERIAKIRSGGRENGRGGNML